MRRIPLALLVLLLVGAVVLNSTALAHVHDESGPGLQNAQCPYGDLAPRSVGLLPSSPDVAPQCAAPVLVSLAIEGPATEGLPATASPRAPPRS